VLVIRRDLPRLPKDSGGGKENDEIARISTMPQTVQTARKQNRTPRGRFPNRH
jgi:hypothetical protein